MGLDGNRITSSLCAYLLLLFILFSLRGCSGFSIKSRTTKDSSQLVIEGKFILNHKRIVDYGYITHFGLEAADGENEIPYEVERGFSHTVNKIVYAFSKVRDVLNSNSSIKALNNLTFAFEDMISSQGCLP